MPKTKKPTSKTDHQQCIKEWIASLEKSFSGDDERVRVCVRFFKKNLVFASGLGRGFYPKDFAEHINAWCLGFDDDDYWNYFCVVGFLYSIGDVRRKIADDQIKIVGCIRGLQHESTSYHTIEGLGITKEETSKLEAIHAKASPLVKQYLEDMQQYLRENSSDILAKYRGRSHFHESCIRKAWIKHCPRPYLSDEEQAKKKKRGEPEAKNECEVVDPNIKTILKIVRDAFDVLVSHLKERCINHLMDVLDLCISYPSSDCLLPPEYWVESPSLTQIKRIHSLVTEKVLYEKYLTDADEQTIERCRAVVSEIIGKAQSSAKKRCAKELKKQIESYKERESVAAGANASQLGLMAHPEVKASELGETDEKQSQGSRKAVSWAASI